MSQTTERREVAGSETTRPRLSVGLVVLRDFTLLPFAGMIDVLRLAADVGDRSRQAVCHWRVMTADGQPVRASCGTLVKPDGPVGDLEGFDYIAVCGGLLHGGVPTDQRIDDYLRRAARAGIPLIGLCTAVFTLIRLGLMSGRRACVSWYHYQELVAAFPDVTPVADRLFVVDGPRITCAGGLGAVDLGAFLVQRHLGQAAADKALSILIADRARPGDAPQPHAAFDHRANDPRLKTALALMEQTLSAPLGIADLAGRIGLSRRQLERIFLDELELSPSAYYRALRLQQGCYLLGQTDRSITDIAQACGFADASHFARAVRDGFGCTPAILRHRVRAGALAQHMAGGNTGGNGARDTATAGRG